MFTANAVTHRAYRKYGRYVTKRVSPFTCLIHVVAAMRCASIFNFASGASRKRQLHFHVCRWSRWLVADLVPLPLVRL